VKGWRLKNEGVGEWGWVGRRWKEEGWRLEIGEHGVERREDQELRWSERG
jgi:hypothetical protein